MLLSPVFNISWGGYSRQLDFFGDFRRLIKWYKTLSLKKAKERQAREVALQIRLQRAQADLQQIPTCPHTLTLLANIQDEITRFESWRIDDQQIPSRVR